MAAAYHCFETPIWRTCLIKTLYTYTFTSLICHGVGKGGSITPRALEVEFCGFAVHLHALARPPTTPATAAQACEGLYFCGTRKIMYESRLKIIPIDISFVWCSVNRSVIHVLHQYPIIFLLFDDRCQSSKLLDEKSKSSKYGRVSCFIKAPISSGDLLPVRNGPIF